MLHHVSWIWSFNTPGPKLFSGTMFRLPTAKFHQNTGFQPSKWIQMEQFFLQHYIIIKCVRPWLQGLHHNFWALKSPLYPGPAPFGQPNPTARWGGDSFGSRRCAKDTTGRGQLEPVAVTRSSLRNVATSSSVNKSILWQQDSEATNGLETLLKNIIRYHVCVYINICVYIYNIVIVIYALFIC